MFIHNKMKVFQWLKNINNAPDYPEYQRCDNLKQLK